MNTFNSLLDAIDKFYCENGIKPTRIKLRVDIFENLKRELFKASAKTPLKSPEQSIEGIPVEVARQQPEWVLISE